MEKNKLMRWNERKIRERIGMKDEKEEEVFEEIRKRKDMFWKKLKRIMKIWFKGKGDEGNIKFKDKKKRCVDRNLNDWNKGIGKGWMWRKNDRSGEEIEKKGNK